VTLRPPTLDDVPELAAMFAGAQREHGARMTSEAELRQWLTSPRFDVANDFRVATDATGAIVGAADVWDQNRAHERFFLGVRAYPRARGALPRLLDWAVARAAEIAGAGPATVRAGAAEDDGELVDQLRARGFGFLRHFFTMEIELSGDLAEPDLPPGLSLRTFRNGDARAVYDADNDAFADHWDFVPIGFEQWQDFFVRAPDFDPTLQFLAVDGDEIAGIALCRPELRPQIGHVAVLGVRPPWRRRGLGRALILHAFREFRRRGVPRVDLDVDADSTTGAVKLYERAGMRVAGRRDTYERVVP
jgi:mycothiol synthase